MKRVALKSLVALLLSCGSAFAAHPVQLLWTGSPSSPVTYNVYRAPCNDAVIVGNVCANEGPFTLIFNTTQATYTDGTVDGSTKWSYYVTSLCSGTCSDGSTGESAGTNHVGVTVPQDTDSGGGVF